MKNILVMAGTGVGLFTATVVGLLGMQGRLNYEGTRGLPLISSLFSAPEEQPQEPAAEGDAAEDESQAADTPEDPKVDLLGAGSGVKITERSVSFDDEAGKESGDKKPPTGEESEQTKKQDKAKALQAKPSPREEWMRQEQSARGKAGEFFKFPQMETSLTVEEINEIYRYAKQAQEAADRRLNALDEREKKLEQRERDVQDRGKALSGQILEIQRMERELQDKVAEFEGKVLLISKSKEQDLQPYADSLAAFEPDKAAEIVRNMWETESGRLRISMVLKIMDPEVANTILSELEVTEIKDILDNLLKVHREKGSGK
ncbi:MAG: MotE family protein [Planctomycetota bacterium]|jgi:hypothetical protein